MFKYKSGKWYTITALILVILTVMNKGPAIIRAEETDTEALWETEKTQETGTEQNTEKTQETGIQQGQKEFRGVWIAYYDFEETMECDEEDFTEAVSEMFDNVAGWGMNAVMVHVRPFGDAMYRSDYFPWSYYSSGRQGVNPGYDPLKIMVREAHKRNLEIHAWINPYRVTSSWGMGTDIESLSKKNKARKWLTNKKTSDDRYVLEHNGALYYNPSVSAVRKLIVDGVKEIVANYEVDGIHFDDYFYPALGTGYESNFDAPEYEAYAEKRRALGKSVKPIEEWRKNNVNTLIKSVYAAVKETRENVIFGISPGGYIDYFDDVDRWYVDYRTWMSEEGYIDYICPQLYWSFNTKNTYPFYETLKKWCAAGTNENVRVYAGLPAYKMNQKINISTQETFTDTEWFNQFLLADMVRYLRREDRASGFIMFDYSDMIQPYNEEAMKYFKEEVGTGSLDSLDSLDSLAVG